MCTKQKYDKKLATTALNHCKKEKGKKYRNEGRIYECPNKECNGAFHLTSKKEYYIKEEIPIEELVFRKEWERLMYN